MKKQFLIVLFALVALGHSAPTYSKALKGNIGQSLPLFGTSSSREPQQSSLIYLDTMEVDTSYFFYDLIDKPVVSLTDTVGFVSFAVKDSVGTDSAAARVVWWGNSRSDGKGTWSLIDSVTKGPTGSATTYAAATPTPVVNSKGYAAIMFTLRNPLLTAVAQKCVVKDVMLNRRPRLVAE